MLQDVLMQVSDSQQPTQGTSTVSTTSIPVGARQIGDGEPLAMVFNVEAITPAADAYTFALISSTAEDLGSSVRVHTQVTLTAAQIAAMKNLVVLPLPPGTPTQAYLGARYTLGAADALTVSAALMALSTVPQGKDYPVGGHIE